MKVVFEYMALPCSRRFSKDYKAAAAGFESQMPVKQVR